MSIPLGKNPTINSNRFGNLFINRISPEDSCVHIEWSYGNEFVRDDGEFYINISTDFDDCLKAWDLIMLQARVKGSERSLCIEGLSNGVDYSVTLSAYQNGELIALAPVRLFRTSPCPGVTVAYCHPDDYTFNSSGRSPASPSILRLPSGLLLISHDMYWGNGGQNLTHVYYSNDDGATWHFRSEVHPCFWGKLFWHQNKLFIQGTSTEYGDLMLFCSKDEGITWSDPVILIHGKGLPEKKGPLACPTPFIISNNRLWKAIEYKKESNLRDHDAGAISISIDDDPMISTNWVCTSFTRYDPELPRAIKQKDLFFWEGNLVAAPDGSMVDVIRFEVDGKAIVYRIDKDNPSSAPTFDRIIDFPGNRSKFTILWDNQNKVYISLVNRYVLPLRRQRNILSLSVSRDLYNWKVVKDILNYQDMAWPEGYLKTAFQYIDFFIEDGNIFFASRTAIGGAYNYHNANRITFHKIDNYKQYL
ncbi:glycoside hydrolase [Treponema sp. OttesenSCG-928-L16]|nr:glycoside hydrolase [Treponema sp. OttesenSCG-928-L16]